MPIDPRATVVLASSAGSDAAVREILGALDLPCSDDLCRRVEGVDPQDLWRHAPYLLTGEMARGFWRQWNPDPAQAVRADDPHFVECFRSFLADGLELGYRLERFREISRQLPDPDSTAGNWRTFFEDVLSAEDTGTIRLTLSRAQHLAFQASNLPGADGAEPWSRQLSMLSDGLFYELGLVLPAVRVVVDDALAPSGFRCEWNDVRRPARRGLEPSQRLVNESVDRLRLLGISAQPAINPATGLAHAVIDQSMEAKAREAGLTTWGPCGYVVLALAAMIRGAAAALVHRPLVEFYLRRLRKSAPETVAAWEKHAPTPARDYLTGILRELLMEGISVRQLEGILEGALDLRSTLAVDGNRFIVFAPPTGGVLAEGQVRPVSSLSPVDYAGFVRCRLKRYISHKYTRGQSALIVYLVDREIEHRLGSPEPLDAATESAILEGVREEVGSLPPSAQQPVILTSAEIRRRLRRLIAREHPQLAVLAYQELSPELNIQPIARITAKTANG